MCIWGHPKVWEQLQLAVAQVLTLFWHSLTGSIFYILPVPLDDISVNIAQVSASSPVQVRRLQLVVNYRVLLPKTWRISSLGTLK